VLSADGYQWVNQAYVTDYLEKAFGGITRNHVLARQCRVSIQCHVSSTVSTGWKKGALR
jgi:hypothetical protein